MITPIFKHYAIAHTFHGNIAIGDKIYDVYTTPDAHDGKYGEVIYVRHGNKPNDIKMMPAKFVSAGMNGSPLAYAKSYIEARRKAITA